MSIELLPEFIRQNYELHEWKHSCAILKEDFPEEWKDIISVLHEFRLYKSWITNPGGGNLKYLNSWILIFISVDGRKRNLILKWLLMSIQWIRRHTR
jgi:hypothetical protein